MRQKTRHGSLIRMAAGNGAGTLSAKHPKGRSGGWPRNLFRSRGIGQTVSGVWQTGPGVLSGGQSSRQRRGTRISWLACIAMTIGAGCSPASSPSASTVPHEQEAVTVSASDSGDLIAASLRTKIETSGLTVTTHDGQTASLNSLLDRPTAISFFYSRCDNPNKCACTVSRFAKIRETLINDGIADETQLLLFTFEPNFDDPGRLRSFAKSYDLVLDGNTRMIQGEPEKFVAFMRELEVPVSYSDQWVTLHGMCVYLTDSSGRIALALRNGLWDPDRLGTQLGELVRENAHSR